MKDNMDNSNLGWSRRQFIISATGAGTAIVLSPFSSWASSSKEFDPRIAKIVAKTFGIDTHSHMDVPYSKEEFIGQKYNLAEQMKTSGLTAVCMTFQVDRPDLTKEGEAYERFNTCLDEMDEILKRNDINRALNLNDLKKAKKENKPIVIQSVEGGHFIEGEIERIAIAYNRGVRHLGLLHDNQSLIPLGDIYTDTPRFGGLTEMGKKVIRECNSLGILIDLTHCSNDTINDALQLSTKPIIISHTGLDTQLGNDPKMSKMMRPRLISEKQAKIVAKSGGVIGVWTHLAESPMEYAQNIKAMVNTIGIDHVCLGTDTKMVVPEGFIKRQGGTTNTAWKEQKEGFYYVVVDALLKTGFNQNDIEKIGGGNYLRVFDAATKK
ncbi:dipeptidase [Flavobacterium sp. WC2429]|uniref:Dipeptidase n=2 Tax=unclassified Flavobacterium TaxID=196869 RepID=A0AB39WA13_9FLAO